jgi:adenylylsulfate kinase-like enzyme
MIKVLIMGLPGSGKTTMANALAKTLQDKGMTVTRINADTIRQLHNDFDFSLEGRINQCKRLTNYANQVDDDFAIVDFICPFEETREIFNADVVIWMDTIFVSRYPDTDKIFEKPINYKFRIEYHDEDKNKWTKIITDYLMKELV